VSREDVNGRGVTSDWRGQTELHVLVWLPSWLGLDGYGGHISLMSDLSVAWGVPCLARSLSCATVVVNRSTSWITRLFSVLNLKDFIMRTVRVAEVFGLVSFVRISDIVDRERGGGRRWRR
jgi:hypothetical protein